MRAQGRESFDPDFSPDGTQFVYVEACEVARDTFQKRIAVIDVDGKNRRALTRYGGCDEINPKWMPDGKRIVFERRTEKERLGPGFELYTGPSAPDQAAVAAPVRSRQR